MNIFSFLLKPKKERFKLPYHGVIVYDVFTFFNELDLLEIRLSILDNVVDYFVIIEATETFSGKPKKLFYEKNKDLFKKWHHKIIHYIVDDTPNSISDIEERLTKTTDPVSRQILTNTLTTDVYPKELVYWMKEFYQKESIKKALVGAPENALCFISDVDEIWNPSIPYDVKPSGIYKLKQRAYSYFLNNSSSERWAGTILTSYKQIKNSCLNHLRNTNKTKYTYIPNAGWHFTNMGGVEQLRTKIESYGHQELNTEEIKSQLEYRILTNKDFAGRKFKFTVDESGLPDYLITNKLKYLHLFK